MNFHFLLIKIEKFSFTFLHKKYNFNGFVKNHDILHNFANHLLERFKNHRVCHGFYFLTKTKHLIPKAVFYLHFLFFLCLQRVFLHTHITTKNKNRKENHIDVNLLLISCTHENNKKGKGKKLSQWVVNDN